MRITKILLNLVLLFFCSIYALKAQSPNCKKFKTGTFTMTYQGKKGIIKRYGNTQEEYLNGEGKPTMVFTVNWLSDCTYTLTPTAATRKAFPEIPKEGTMTVKITKTTTKTYTYSASYIWDKKKTYENTMTLIK
jgi:hypothetical protein